MTTATKRTKQPTDPTALTAAAIRKLGNVGAINHMLRHPRIAGFAATKAGLPEVKALTDDDKAELGALSKAALIAANG